VENEELRAQFAYSSGLCAGFVIAIATTDRGSFYRQRWVPSTFCVLLYVTLTSDHIAGTNTSLSSSWKLSRMHGPASAEIVRTEII
jgi:hypothetical protein